MSWTDRVGTKERKVALALADAFATLVSVLLGLIITAPSQPFSHTLSTAILVIPIFVTARIALSLGLGVYVLLWRYASIKDLLEIVKVGLISSVAILIAARGFGVHALSNSFFLTEMAFNVLVAGGIRVGLRLFRDYLRSRQFPRQEETDVIIIGAGDGGALVAAELLKSTRFNYRIVGFLDDRRQKYGQKIHQIPVLGPISRLPEFVKLYDINEVIIAVPSASGSTVREWVDLCKDIGVRFKITRSVEEFMTKNVSASELRDVQIDDLLGRKPVDIDLSAVSRYVTNATVLVTGAGGSIGSELCRQLLNFDPTHVVLVDHSEDAIYHIERELRQMNVGNVQITAVVADAQCANRLNPVFNQTRPHVVFHAAAYKHVPLMEENVSGAIQNNIGATRNVFDLAAKHGVQQCILISTDKAVNPTSVMGATKRICEFLMHIYNANFPDTKFVAVRFGNVLGSNGSVVPLFKEQIAKGGPVTITHPDVTRYFMTIPEAVRLVIQAGAIGQGGEIFVLDMGEPIKIVTLAKDMIRLSGFEEGRDIQIKMVGLRPGEKLYEELFYEKEYLTQTSHPKIMVSSAPWTAKNITKDAIDLLLIESASATDDHLRDRVMTLTNSDFVFS